MGVGSQRVQMRCAGGGGGVFITFSNPVKGGGELWIVWLHNPDPQTMTTVPGYVHVHPIGKMNWLYRYRVKYG